MNWIVSSVLLVYAVNFAAGNPIGAVPKCKDGEKWLDDCNTCSCIRGKPACTLISCVPTPHPTPIEKRSSDCDCDPIGSVGPACEENGACQCKPHFVGKRCNMCEVGYHLGPNGCTDQCTPLTAWKESNKVCTCSEQGIKSCVTDSVRSKRETQANKACKPGDTWMDDCNQCTCNHDGKASCSRQLCEKDQPEEIPWLLGQEEQKQSKTTKREAGDGVSKKIKRQSRPPAGCQPGETYFDGCNQCVCQESGPPSCTYKICPPNTQVQTVSFSQLPQSSQQHIQQ